jgi:hypothetical protein
VATATVLTAGLNNPVVTSPLREGFVALTEVPRVILGLDADETRFFQLLPSQYSTVSALMFNARAEE